MSTKELKVGGTQVWSVLLCVCMLSGLVTVPLTEAAVTTPGKDWNPPTLRDSSDVIMHEDAAEVFYNVDIQKYDDLGIKCPQAVPPESGYIVGEGERVGTTVYVRCRRGYRLHGPTVMACMPSEDGAQWSPDVPRECRENVDGGFDEERENANDIHERPAILDQSMIKGGGDPPFLTPGSQYWETQMKRRERLQEEDSTVENQEEVDALPASCRLRPLAGPCRAAFRRYFFDPASMECHLFVYGGCHGNDNNFRTVNDCNEKCLRRE